MKILQHNTNFDFEKLPRRFRNEFNRWVSGTDIKPLYAYFDRWNDTGSTGCAIIVACDPTESQLHIARLWDVGGNSVALSVEHVTQLTFPTPKRGQD